MGTALESRHLNTRDDVARVFESFRDQQSEITLRFESRAEPCKARVLDIDGDFVLLQNVVPEEGVRLLEQGASFSVSGRADGLFMYMTDNRALTGEADLAAARETGFFRMPLPLNATYQQRRRTSRHRLPVRVSTDRSFIKLGIRTPVYARILDISTLGARLHIEPARENTVALDEAFPHAYIHVPHTLSVTVAAVVRHTRFDAERAVLVCGIEFVDSSPATLVKLREFVTQISG